MRVGVLIQTRERSTVGPDCRLATLGTRSVLTQVVQRVRGLDDIEGCAILTGTDARDHGVVEVARLQGLPYFRSPADRPGQAMRYAVTQLGWDAVIAIRCDSPLISVDLLEQARRRFIEGDYDLVSVGAEQGFPLGLEVEIIRSRWLIARAPLIRLADERQPLLSWFQPTVPRFATLALSDQTDWSDVSLAIESPQDLEQMRWLSQAHGTSLWHWPWEVVAAEVRRWGASRLSSDEAAA